MERKINRLDKYIAFKGLNDNRITVECGISNGLLGNARRGESDLGTKTIEKILKRYGDLNRVWLLTGEGKMLNPGSSTSGPNSPIVSGHDNFFDQKSDCTEIIRAKDELIGQLRGEVEYLRNLTNTLMNK